MADGNSTGKRLARLKDFPGVPLSTDEIPTTNQVQVPKEGLDEFKITVDDLLRVTKEGYDAQIQALRDELVLVKQVVAVSSSAREGHSKLKISEPKPYNGARGEFKNLKQTGTVQDYVKVFSSLLLDIKNMSDEDKLFNFLAGLKPWAHAELRRQVVRDLLTTIVAADGLIDYKKAGSQYAEMGKNSGKNHKGEDKNKKNDRKNCDAKYNRKS
ncbi:hypothetical protein AgCh_017182 [Apium graveolens]